MATTDKCTWTYPDENVRDWFTTFVSMLTGIDESVFAAREDRNLVVATDAEFTFNAGTNTVSWDASIGILGPTTGFVPSVAAGSMVLPDGKMAVIQLVRAPQSTGVLTVDIVDVVTDSIGGVPIDQDGVFLLAVRRDLGVDERVFFRNGVVLRDGQFKQVFGGSCSGSCAVPTRILLTTDKQVDNASPGPLSSGYTALSGSSFGNGAILKFMAVAGFGGPTPGIHATVTLYNLTNGEAVTSGMLDFVAAGPAKLASVALVIGAGAGNFRLAESIYEVRLELVGSADPADIGLLGSAWLELTYA
jgi:hypothetical protein